MTLNQLNIKVLKEQLKEAKITKAWVAKELGRKSLDYKMIAAYIKELQKAL
jgi:hypothetical protein